MGLIKAGLGIGRTIKNVNRLREILAIFASNGFDEFLIQSGVLKKIPDFVLPSSKNKLKQDGTKTELVQSIGYRLRVSFETLGPSFVKLGQLLATREDMFPHAFILEMKKLQSRVKGIPYLEVCKIIERSFGKSIEDIFISLDENPVGTASIGVVHKGILQTGEPVVVKVRRPNIRSIIETDFEIVSFVVESIEKVSEEVRHLGLSKVVSDFSSSIEKELDFNIESLNCRRLRENIEKHDKKKLFVLPKIYPELVKEDVLVMEYLDGIAFDDAEKIKPHLKTVEAKLTAGLEIFIKTILEDGFFHADLHGGNFFLLKDNKIGIVDFGLMGSMSRVNRSHFVAIIYSLLNQNYENLIYEFLEVADYDKVPDVDALIRDAKEKISPFVGLSAQNINFPLLLRAIVETLTTHKLYLPRDWYIVFRALITMDGVGKSLGMDFDLFAILEKDMDTIIQSFVSKDQLIEEGVWVARDLMSALRVLPRHLRWFSKEFTRKNYRVDIGIKDLGPEVQRLQSSVVFLGLAILASVFIYSGLHFLTDEPYYHLSDIPRMTWIFWSMALVAFLRGLFLVRK